MYQARTKIAKATFNPIREEYNKTGRFDTKFKEHNYYFAHIIYMKTTNYNKSINNEVYNDFII